MDIKSYISSGILELYVLGKLSPEEEEGVRQMAAQYPEVRNELTAVEIDLERFDRSQAVTPPEGILQHILNRLDPSPVGLPANEGNVAQNSWSKITAWMLVGIVSLLGLWLYLENQKLKDESTALRRELEQLRADCQENENLNIQLTKLLEELTSSSTRSVILAGSELSPTSRARVYYSPETDQSYLASVDLPTPPTGKQYQLWALVDGQPVSMGVFDLDNGATPREVPYVAGAGAFAVTLEDAGGKPTPNLEQLYLIGEISS